MLEQVLAVVPGDNRGLLAKFARLGGGAGSGCQRECYRGHMQGIGVCLGSLRNMPRSSQQVAAARGPSGSSREFGMPVGLWCCAELGVPLVQSWVAAQALLWLIWAGAPDSSAQERGQCCPVLEAEADSPGSAS